MFGNNIKNLLSPVVPVETKRKKGYQPGAAWKGNRFGRPRKHYLRDDFTDEIFQERKADIRQVTERLFIHALNDKAWAIKLVFEYFLTRPKNRESVDETANRNEIEEKLKNFPTAKLVTIQKMLIEELEKVEEEA